ncbi:UDP-glycosyltransferase 90A1 [Amborella trichopoda]|uniref:UDP-glycosyltransferase 90A1 n=1 Tax=Amborella trichopoda TaxID=13333 RepID=UPI0005D3C2F6|nr:UDP-glycosyltransferase 90A1 [Amborella trichopoda]|eukprot:XP_011623925.1 UDP-glycosyltransferase 90A1 [Amborella trichopoda]
MATTTTEPEIIRRLTPVEPTRLSMERTSAPHIAVFPFMSRGHAIPLLHLCATLLRRGLELTIFSTPSNSPFYRQSLPKDSGIRIIDLPFPSHPDLPKGCESTEQLPSMDMFLPFLNAVKELRDSFEQSLSEIAAVNPPICLISDTFLYWTQYVAEKLSIPRLTFMGTSAYATCLSLAIAAYGSPIPKDSEPVLLPGLPHEVRLAHVEVPPTFRSLDPKDPSWTFVLETGAAKLRSYGEILNSFYELEPEFVKTLNTQGQRYWCVGPMCLWDEPKPVEIPKTERAECLDWLDMKDEGSVLYVAFGSQARLEEAQMREIGAGLEGSGLNFLWVVRGEPKLDDGFGDRVKGRGLVIRGWVPQVEVLSHNAVGGFMSHCGWNSLLESLVYGVPILGWPMMAEQSLNGKMVEEELGVGSRVVWGEGEKGEVVEREVVEREVVELMRGEKGRRARERGTEIKEKARRAVHEGGSSYNNLSWLINELCERKK